MLIQSGARNSWKQLLNSQCGIVSLRDRGRMFQDLPSQVAGIIPNGPAARGRWDAKEWLAPGVTTLRSQISNLSTDDCCRTNGDYHCSRSIALLQPKRHLMMQSGNRQMITSGNERSDCLIRVDG